VSLLVCPSPLRDAEELPSSLSSLPPAPDGPALPQPRGPVSRALIELLRDAPDATDGRAPIALSSTDEDAHLALHCIYELSYRGFAGVSDEWEWDPRVLAVRRTLERRFEDEVRRAVAVSGLTDGARTVQDVIDRFSGPSLSSFMAREGSREQFTEFCIHRSAYQLKEADGHSWGLPRFSGPRKAAFVEIQADEYGNGRIGEAHADLFASVLTALGTDAAYGSHIDAIPATTLATDNLVSLFGTQRRLRSALLGHLAGFEMTSVVPMSRYLQAARRLGLGPRVERFYAVHVDADTHHGALAATQLVGADPEADGLDSTEIRFGTAAMLVLEDRFARSVLDAWAAGRSSLRTASAA